MKKYLLSALAFSTLTTGVHADCTSTGCYGVIITRLYVTNGGTIYIATNGDESALNCTSPGNAYLSVGHEDPGKNALYSMMLTAQTTSKAINLRVTEESDSCNILFATIDS